MCTYVNPSPITNFRHLDTGHLHGYISSYSTVHLPKVDDASPFGSMFRPAILLHHCHGVAM